jgi:O-antigen/teichoic acid export membrane protein
MSAQGPTPPAMQQREGTSLRTDFSWTFLGNAVYSGGQLAALVLLAKLTRPELVGQYALGLAIAVPVITFASLQLRLALVSDVYQQTHFGHYLSLRLVTTGLALLIIFAITQFPGYRWQLRAVVLLVGVAQAIEAISDMFYARLQLHDRMSSISKSLIARAVLSALGLTIGVYFTGNLLWGIVGIVLARAMVLLGYDIRERTQALAEQSKGFPRDEDLKPRWDLRVQGKLLSFNFRLAILWMLVSLTPAIPRYFIEHSLGERTLGIFSAIASMRAAGDLAAFSLGLCAFTRLTRFFAAENLVEFRSLLGKLLALGATLGVCGIIVANVAGREILGMLLRPEYAERADLLPWIMAIGGGGCMALFLGVGMTAARYYNSQIVLFVLTNLAVAVACHVLIPQQELLGAVFAMLIGVIVQLAGSAIILVIGMRKHTSVCAQIVKAA